MSEELLKRIPTWLIGVALILFALIVMIQRFGLGQPIYANGVILPSKGVLSADVDDQISSKIAELMPANLEQRLAEATDKASSAETAASNAFVAVSEFQTASDAQLTEFGERFTALDSKDEQLADQIGNVGTTEPADLTPLQTAIDTHSHNDLGNRVAQLEEALLHGAVVAFDRSERGVPTASGTATGGGGACPPRWSLFVDAGGRVIIGAGQHPNVDEDGGSLKTYPAHADNSTTAVGGKEKLVLTENELPTHTHTFNGEGRPLGPPGGIAAKTATAGETDYGNYFPEGTIGATGKGASFTSMPPYIALYFCKYDGSG